MYWPANSPGPTTRVPESDESPAPCTARRGVVEIGRHCAEPGRGQAATRRGIALELGAGDQNLAAQAGGSPEHPSRITLASGRVPAPDATVVAAQCRLDRFGAPDMTMEQPGSMA